MMHRALLVSLALLSAPALVRAQQAAPTAEPALTPGGRTRLDLTAVAVVGGDTLTVAAFEAAYADHLLATGRNDDAPTRRTFMDEWIDRHLLAREARRQGLDQAPEFQAALALETGRAAAGRFLETEVLERLPDPTDRDLRWAYVRANTKRTVRVLFFRREADATAAHARLEAGADFVALASENRGFAVYDSLAGYLGPIQYYSVEDAFAEAAYAAPVGTYTAPVRTRRGWYVIRVEDAAYEVLLTEDGYETRREGLSSQFRERRRRLEADRFTRERMAALDVRVNAEAVRTLSERLAAGATVEAALADLRPDAPLAAYGPDGARRTFTAADLARWLPALPASELASNLSAALGRAIRNETFAAEGLARGLEGSIEARLDVERWRVNTLSERMLQAAPVAVAEPAEADLREAYARLPLTAAARTAVSYWAAPFATQADAMTAAQAAASAGAAAPGATVRERSDAAAEPLLGAALRAAPVGEPVVYAAADGRWYAVGVTARETERVPYAAVRDALAASLRADLQRIAFVRALRASEPVALLPAAYAVSSRSGLSGM